MIYHKKSEFWLRKILIMKNMKWKQLMANYKNCLCQNFNKTVLTEGALCEFVEGKWWKKSNEWIFSCQQHTIISSVVDLDSRKKLKKSNGELGIGTWKLCSATLSACKAPSHVQQHLSHGKKIVWRHGTHQAQLHSVVTGRGIGFMEQKLKIYKMLIIPKQFVNPPGGFEFNC